MNPIKHPLFPSNAPHGFFNHDNQSVISQRLRSPLITPKQTHSTNVALVSAPVSTVPLADALVSSTPGVALGVYTADCIPVLFCDPIARVVAAAHAGWRGLFNGVLENTLLHMKRLNSSPQNVLVGVGPAIHARSYHVQQDFQKAALLADPRSSHFFLHNPLRFQLPQYAFSRLLHADVPSHNIRLSHICVHTDPRFSSHRRGDASRQISAVSLSQQIPCCA